MGKVISPRNVLFGFLLVALVIAFEIILPALHLPTAPAFMVMIFFFVAHEDASKAPHILVGGLAGIFCVVLIGKFKLIAGPYLGEEWAKLAFIGLFVYSIVLLKDAIPHVFNSYAFMFFLVSALGMQSNDPNPNAHDPYVWMGVELVVGVIFIVGVLGIVWIVDKVLGPAGDTPAH